MNDTAHHAGLSAEEAARRLAADGPNSLPDSGRRGLPRIVADAAREPMFLLLLAAGLLYLLLGELREGLFLFLMVLLTLGLTLYQEGRTEHALEALRDISSPRARVVRDSQRRTVDSRDLVRITATGPRSEIGGIGAALGTLAPEPLQRQTARLVAVFATLIVVNLGLIFANRSRTDSIAATLRASNPALWLVRAGERAEARRGARP